VGVTRPPIWLRALGVVSLALGALLVALTVLTAARSDHRHMRESTEREILSAAQAESEALNSYFAEARSVILVMAQNAAMRELFDTDSPEHAVARREVDDALAYLARLYPHSLGEASVIDSSGEETARLVRDGRSEDRFQDERNHEFVRATLKLAPGEVHQSRPYLSSDTDQWVLSNSTPLPLGDGGTRALLHFEVTIEHFRRAAARAGRGMVTRVVEPGSGRIVFDSRYPQSHGGSLGSSADPELVAAVVRAGAGTGGALRSVRGQTVAIQALEPTPGNDNRWRVVVSMAAKTAAPGWKPSAATTILLAAGLAFLGLALLTFRAYARILRRAALTDDLTHLPNRALLVDRARSAILQARRSGRHVAALMLDLNRFKEINDTLGHQEAITSFSRWPSASAVRCRRATRWRALAATSSSSSPSTSATRWRPYSSRSGSTVPSPGP
jgi:hypothetical protein